MRKLIGILCLLVAANAAIAKTPTFTPITGYFFYVCTGATTPFFDGTTGGTWSIDPSDAAIASVSPTGVVTGLSAGTATLSYSVGSSVATAVVSVFATPSPIMGALSVCKPLTTLLSDATPGGVWSSETPSGAPIDSNGLVTGINHGVYVLDYTMAPAGCKVSFTLTVYPYTPTLTGSDIVCLGATSTLYDIRTDGVWSGSNSNAVVDGSGNVTGLAVGTASITYTEPTTCFASMTITVNPLAGPISGNLQVCTGWYTYLSDASTPALSWSSNSPDIATVTATGVVTALAVGTATITYTLNDGCTATTVVTVNPAPTAIGGFSPVCAGATETLSDAVTGGTWSSNNATIASVGTTTGTVTGVSPGTKTITYGTTGVGCYVLAVMTVNPAPNAGVLLGGATVCTGNTLSLSDVATGGSWTSSNPAVGTVSTSGLVRGITAGTTAISYTVTNSCGSASATNVVTVGLSPAAGTISGSTTLCAGSVTSLSDAASGGVWSSSSTNASVDGSGNVTGNTAGTATISYTVSGACGNASATTVITINALSAGTVNGVSTVTAGMNTSLTDATPGGVWSSSNSNATVSAGGIVTGVTPGSCTISYTLTNSCGTVSATKVITVNVSSVAPITGPTSVCTSATISLTDATAGGAWSTANGVIAGVNASGVVTGLSVGTTVISYTVAGIPSVIVITVNSVPSGIYGPSTVCNGRSITLSDLTAGGTWTSTAGISATTGTTLTTITGLAAGTNYVTYTLATGCYKTMPVTVGAIPSAILGTLSVCGIGSVTFLSDATAGTSWAINPVGTATISASGRVYGVSAGTAIVTYTGNNSCVVTAPVTVALPPSAITNNTTICQGSSITLSDVAAGGSWSSSNTAIATVGSSTGTVNGVTPGTATITYATAGGTGCYVMAVVTVNLSGSAGTVSGAASLCVGATTTLTDAVAGGVWSSSNPAVGTVSSSGVVNGLASGTTTISYSITNTCGALFATKTVTVGLAPTAGTISGVNTVCTGSVTSLTDVATGGAWSSSNANASVDGSGNVTGNTAGTATISYTISSSCGTVSATTIVTINGLSAGTISGASTVTAGLFITLSDAAAGGVWSASNGNATVSAGGSVAGVTAGTVTISYSVSNGCGSAVATKLITVNASSVSGITGSPSVCVASTTSLTDGTSGGAWSTSNGVIASVNMSGVVTGNSVGTAMISYTVAGIPSIVVVTVNPAPSGIYGPAVVCNGLSVTLSDLTTGGAWTSTAGISATTGSSTTIVTGLAAGTNYVTYTLPTGCYKTMTFTVGAIPSPILGTLSVCGVGAVTFLSDATLGTTWAVNPVSTATVSPSGRIYGVSAGTAVVTYTGNDGCVVTATVTVAIPPSTITNNASVCPGASVTLSDLVAGGVWSSSNTAIGTVAAATGTVTGISAGTTTISYVTNGSCYVTAVVTVNVAPNAGTLSGSATLCTGTTTNLTDAATGGVWSSSNTAIGTVSTTGVVRGISAGTSTISYTVTNLCGSVSATDVVTVGLAATAGTISGVGTVCTGSITSLTDAVVGGTWSSSNSNASVDGSGNVTGNTAGTAIISYTIGSSCGTLSATTVVTVNGLSAGTINGASAVMAAFNISLSDAVTGGVWSSSNADANISTSGVVTGITPGTVTISYTITNGCGTVSATKVVTVNASSVAPISGSPSACIASTTTLTDATAGGAWSTSNGVIASVNMSGIVTGNSAGTVVISYTVAGIPAIVIVTVNPAPSGISGSSSVCNGSSITLSDATVGGAWTSASGVSVTNGTNLTTVTSLSVGTSLVTYSLPTGCFKTFSVTVKAIPTAILGNLSVCGVGAVTFLSDATAGTTWVVNPVGTATISPSGRVYGVSAGTAIVTYTANDGCVITATTTVNALITAAPISGATNVSHGATISLSDATPGGLWTSSNAALGSVDGLGDVTGVGTSGTVTISYTVLYGSGCSTVATKAITVHTPAPPTRTTTTTVGETILVADEFAGGQWTTDNNSILSVDDNGVATAIAAGDANIIHAVTGTDGSEANVTTHIIVSALPFEVRLQPNPNNGTFTVSGIVGSNKDEVVTLEITNMLGQVIYTGKIIATGGIINEQISLNNLANGNYLMNVNRNGTHKAIQFVVGQ